MSEKMSSSLCTLLLGIGTGHNDLSTIINGNWKLMIYAGVVPSTADAALAGNTLLCTVANAGSAVNMAAALTSAGVLPKLASETWSGTNAASGTASFYRFQKTADAGGADAGAGVTPRIQGTVGTTSAFDMQLDSVAFISGAVTTINTFVQTLLPS